MLVKVSEYAEESTRFTLLDVSRQSARTRDQIQRKRFVRIERRDGCYQRKVGATQIDSICALDFSLHRESLPSRKNLAANLSRFSCNTIGYPTL
jgi:hypothetical protein